MIDSKIIDNAVSQARKTMNNGEGGPFGAAIITKDGQIFYASNQVLKEHDPTAHAEICCIRKACKALNTHELSGCILYTTCQPCPMCLSAIIWSNIKEIWYGCNADDADKAGFRDAFIYEYIEKKCKDSCVLKITQIDRDRANVLFEEYKKMSGEIY